MSALRPDRLSAAFSDYLRREDSAGGAVSVWHEGKPLVHQHGGTRDRGRSEPWEEDTLVLVYSATKGLSATCLLHAIESASLDPDHRVCEIWPGFGQHGKEAITLRQVLSHQAGLSALDDNEFEPSDHAAAVSAIETQKPNFPPGSAHAYSPKVIGYILDELLRRLSGVSLGEYWRLHFGEPHHLDFWIGLPEHLHDRVADIHGPRPGPHKSNLEQALADPNSLPRRAFSSPRLLATPSVMNSSAMRSASFPAFGGIGSAHALAKFYSLLACGEILSPKALSWCETTLASGMDLVLCEATAFSAGFLKDPACDGRKTRSLLGPSLRAFGHPGSGGSLAFADPEQGIGFAFVMNQLESSVLPSRTAPALVHDLYG